MSIIIYKEKMQFLRTTAGYNQRYTVKKMALKILLMTKTDVQKQITHIFFVVIAVTHFIY